MTIPLNSLKQVSVIYTHANCPDGVASSMILKDAFRMLGMSPRIEFLVHNTKEHQHAGPRSGGDVLFCDIAPHPEAFAVHRFSGWTEAVAHIGHAIVLDHHVGSKEIVESFGDNGVYADAEKEPGVSGAVLAFRECWVPAFKESHPVGIANTGTYAQHQERVMDFALSVGARDTWQTGDPRFQRGQWISKMLMSKPADCWLATEENPYRDYDPKFAFNHPPYLTDNEVEMGRALFEAHEETVRQAVEQCTRILLGPITAKDGVFLYTFQEQAVGFRLTSDVAETIRANFPGDCHAVVAGFSFIVDKPGAEPRLVYSLRGLNGFDVCAFAKTQGGGGHKAAAGFELTTFPTNIGYNAYCVNPYEEIKTRLDKFIRTSCFR